MMSYISVKNGIMVNWFGDERKLRLCCRDIHILEMELSSSDIAIPLLETTLSHFGKIINIIA
jgi:hypothetical protein